MQGNGKSSGPVLSSGGRFVVFLSDASNLVANDTNGRTDIFTYDRQLHQTALLLAAPGGAATEAGTVSTSADGRFVAFDTVVDMLSGGRGSRDIYVRDRQLGKTIWVSRGAGGVQSNGSSELGASISGDGRYVVFSSFATNLVAG